MSVRGLGVDLVELARIRAALERHGERFAGRLLTPAELLEFQHSPDPVAHLARRFAAKEALVKALGTGFRNGIGLQDIAVMHDEAGRPALACSGAAAKALGERGIERLHLSLSDERCYALAFVVAEGP